MNAKEARAQIIADEILARIRDETTPEFRKASSFALLGAAETAQKEDDDPHAAVLLLAADSILIVTNLLREREAAQ